MKGIASIVLISFLSNVAMADCDWSSIKKNPDNTFTYSEQLHLCVGKLVQDGKVKDQQIADLTQAIQLKDLAITKSDERTQLWITTSTQLEDRALKIDELSKKNEWLYFGLGVLATIGAGYAASQLYRH